MQEKFNQKLYNLEEMLVSLEQAVTVSDDGKRFVIDACIRRFRFSFDIIWKTLQIILLKKYGVQATFPRDVFEKSYQGNLINNEAIWLAMMTDRNLIPDCYDNKLANRIHSAIQQSYFPELKKTFLMLKDRFGN